MIPAQPTFHCLPDIFGLTHVGAVRTENEDAIDWWIEREADLCIGVLADGMGGHAGGAYASKLALSSIRKSISGSRYRLPLDQTSIEALLVNAAQTANKAIQQVRDQEEEFSHMGTTLLLAAVWQGSVTILHAGDSRCYLLSTHQSQQKDGEKVMNGGQEPSFTQLTRDDSVVQSMLEEGVITPHDVPNIPYRNRLTNALGIHAMLRYQIVHQPLNSGDVLLLCSDGFHHSVEMSRVSEIVMQEGVSQQAAQGLLQMSLDNKTDDNTSIILIGY